MTSNSSVLQIKEANDRPLVSIITPCYNGEHCVSRMLDSVIAQTYRPIEYILVNDGSTDATQTVAMSYKEKFHDAGIQYIIIQQKNKGLAGAINAGLKVFSGDYLCWPDADDYLEPNSIEERVNILEENPDYAVVSSDAFVRDSTDLQSYKKLLSVYFKHLDDPNQFEHHLNGESIFCCGCHMARTSMFLDVHPDREIYPARYGQNWQLLLPIYYKYKWKYIDKPLYNYVETPDSMSRKKLSLTETLNRINEKETIIVQTLKKIELVQQADMSEYIQSTKEKYAKQRLSTAMHEQDSDVFMKEYEKKKNSVGIDFKDRIYYLCCRYPRIEKVITYFR